MDTDKEKILSILETVTDPEVPVLSIMDLGIVRDISVDENNVEVFITPTYSGCPAMDMIAMNIRMELLQHGFDKVDYIEICDTDTLLPVSAFNKEKKLIALVAAFIENVRLIDNLVL